MYLERKQDLSIYYWLDGLFSSYSSVTVNDGYPDGDLVLPAVVVEGQPIVLNPLEMGNRTSKRLRLWSIDVYATNKAMRDEFTSYILDNIEDGIIVYDYDEGFPPDVSPSQLSTLRPIEIRVDPIRVFPDLVEKLYWRTRINFMTEYKPN